MRMWHCALSVPVRVTGHLNLPPPKQGHFRGWGQRRGDWSSFITLKFVITFLICLQSFQHKCPECINLDAAGWHLRPTTPCTDHALLVWVTFIYCAFPFRLGTSARGHQLWLFQKRWLWQTPALWCFRLQTWEPKSRSICTSEFKNRYYLRTNGVTGREAPVEAGWERTRLCSAVTLWPNSFFFFFFSSRKYLSGREASNCGSPSRHWRGSIQPSFCRHLPK